MSDVIKILPDHIANQIAAGEVVQRPSSVVKELMENAVDAGAMSVKVIIKQAGKELIRVVDDGCGMGPQDARNSFLRHATSKISSAEDLFRLHTKGFRGEALASIAAVAQVEMTTRRSEDELASTVVVEGSRYVDTVRCAAPKGTSVSVKNLFFNIPARRNFLKSDSLEMNRITDEFIRVALAHPSLSFELYRDDTPVYKLSPSSLRRRIVGIFKSNTDNKLVPIDEKTEAADIYGFVYKPEYARAKNAEQFIFVNDRYVKSSYLSSAVLSAFQGLIPDRYYPGYFLYFKVDPARIDINISPTKTEISFDDERTIYTFLRAAVRHSLGQYSVLPALDFTQDQEINNVLDHPKEGVEAPAIVFDPSYNPFEDDLSPRTGGSSAPRGTTSYGEVSLSGKQWEVVVNELEKDSSGIADETQQELFSGTDAGYTMPGGNAPRNAADGKYSLAGGKYILSHIKTGILLIDPVRAHWRIMYEKVKQGISYRGSLSQQILFSVRIELDAARRMAFEGIESELSAIGFHFEKEPSGAVKVLGVPPGVKESEIQGFIDRMIDDFSAGRPLSPEELSENMARSLSYTMAVKNPSALTPQEMENIAAELFECCEPAFAPNGKATFIRIGMDELEKKFD